MRVFWFDRGYMHQSFALPYLPTHDEAMMCFSPGVKHAAPNVVGCENWRVPVLHRLIDDGHQIVWGDERDIMPSEEIDWDLLRLSDFYPEYAPFIRQRDPMLDAELWDIHKPLETAYMERFPKDREKETSRGNLPGSEEYTLKWLGEMIESQAWGMPPEVDVAVIAIIRANVITGFQQTYIMSQYKKMGIPVIMYDQDRQLAATANSLKKANGWSWPDPYWTIIAPYTVGTQWGQPELIDFPYIREFESFWDNNFKRMEERTDGAVYVGNDYERRKLMETHLLPLTDIMPVTVWGKFDKADAGPWKLEWNKVNWAGRVETNRALERISRGKLTVNLIKHTYQKLGQITMRTFESPMAGTLQVGIRENIRIGDFVPRDFISGSTGEALGIAKRVERMTTEEYAHELEIQRKMARRNDLDAYMDRLYELIEKARLNVGALAT